MSITVGNTYIYNEHSAIEMLHNLGFDNYDVEEFKYLLCQEEIEQAEYHAEVAAHEHRASEAMEEAYMSAINEAINMIDDYLGMERITKAREKLEAVQRVLENI